MAFEIAPFRGLRFDLERLRLAGIDPLVAPPYDVISTEEHRDLLRRSPYNIVRLTLGEQPGKTSDYRERGNLLMNWKKEGLLSEDEAPGFFVYGCDYTVPGSDRRATLRGLVGLGHLHSFEDGVVLPHERTFPAVVDDRYRLLEATRTHLELIFLLFEDSSKEIDSVLASECESDPLYRVEVKPGESHALWRVEDPSVVGRLRTLFRSQRPVIADGHHRYTTALLYRDRNRSPRNEQGATTRPGVDWQPMFFGNLVGDGLSILSTHRLVKTGGRANDLLKLLAQRLEPLSAEDTEWHLRVETTDEIRQFRFPKELRDRPGVAGTDYAILHQCVLGEWYQSLFPDRDLDVTYFKEGTGERQALEKGQGDLLFRMRPIGATKFRSVVDGGEVFPHKTTFFYPKLWSGLLLWSMAEPELPEYSGS